MTLFRIINSGQSLFSDPDLGQPPLAQLGGGVVVTVLSELGNWAKIALSSPAGVPQSTGWVLKESLQPVPATPPRAITLFREPMGAESQSLMVVDVVKLLEIATWQKVRVRTTEGAEQTGWIDVAAAPGTSPAPSPAPTPGTSPPSTPAPAPVPAGGFTFGPNEIYRAALLAAEEKTGIDAAALAALIDAEAGFIGSGPNKGQWNPIAQASTSSAAGLTQFLAGTWIAEAKRADTELGRTARAKGYITAAGKLVESAKAELLALRFDPAMAIMAAAEFGLANLRFLINKGLVSASESDDRKAWVMYIAHHEGAAGAAGFLDGSLRYTQSQLAVQVGSGRAAALTAQAGGDADRAYRDWLKGYADSKIRPSKYRVAGGAVTAPAPGVPLAEVSTQARMMMPENPEEVITYVDLPEDSRALLKGYSGEPWPFEKLGGNNRPLAIAVQQALSLHGYLDPPADGSFGPVSTWALAEFCRRLNLPRDKGFLPEIGAALAGTEGGLPKIKTTGTFIDAVIAGMQARRYFITRHPDCVNIVYVEGMNTDGTLNADAPNAFNDVRVTFSLLEDGTPDVHVWQATTEPGQFYTENPLSPKGAARIAFRQFKSWGVGKHPQSKTPQHEALVQTREVTVHRDFNQDFQRTNDRLERGDFGINQHWGYDLSPENIGKASAGCLVGRLVNEHKEFMAIVKSDARYKVSQNYRFVTAILPGDDL